MKVKTNLKAGFDLGQEVSRVAQGVGQGAQAVLNGVGQAAAPIVQETKRIVSDPKFWTWPFGN